MATRSVPCRPSEYNIFPLHESLYKSFGHGKVFLLIVLQSEHVILRARLLCSLFISLLREIKMFSAEAVASQSRAHLPATCFPYVQQGRERWKRCVLS